MIGQVQPSATPQVTTQTKVIAVGGVAVVSGLIGFVLGFLGCYVLMPNADDAYRHGLEDGAR